MRWLGDRVEVKPERYAVDRQFPEHLLCPGERRVQRARRRRSNGSCPTAQSHQLTLRADETYVLPWGTKIRLEKQIDGTAWRLVASRADGMLCHKPCTVSGGGKSEISKSIGSIVLKGPVFVTDFHRDIEQVAEILAKDFSGIYRTPQTGQSRAAPDSEPGALARIGDQADDAFAGIHRRAQRVAGDDSANCPATADHGEALLPAGVGRRLAAALQRRPHQRAARATN